MVFLARLTAFSSSSSTAMGGSSLVARREDLITLVTPMVRRRISVLSTTGEPAKLLRGREAEGEVLEMRDVVCANERSGRSKLSLLPKRGSSLKPRSSLEATGNNGGQVWLASIVLKAGEQS